MWNRVSWTLAGLSSALVASASHAVVLDFEFEDDFVTPLVNGQIIDPFFDAVDLEFGNLVSISSRTIGSDGHLGVTVFDSDAADQLPNTQDPDLLVNRGNILILQNDGSSATSNGVNGLQYDFPNDEKDFNDRGAIVFDFLNPVELLSIDMVDINGSAGATLTLTDADNRTRTYTVPEQWTTDVTNDPVGWQTLDLTTLLPQASEPNAAGGDATAVEDAGFDPLQVVKLDVAMTGSGRHPSPSGAIDTLVFVPEPGSAVLAGLGLLTLAGRRR